MIGVAAGESENPRTTIPRAVSQIFWRILLFYVLAIFVIGVLIPYTDPSLLKSDVTDIGVAPFTLVFRHAGLAFAAGVMNAVILTAVLSAGNSGMYASTRMLYNLAVEGRAPKIFAKLSRGGVPRNALYATTAVGALCFLTSLYGDKTVYLWLLNTSGMAGFITWLGIAVSHYRFRKGFLKQGYRLDQLPYRSKWFPFGPLFAFALCAVIALGQDYQAFLSDKIDWVGVAATYIGLPFFLAIWLGYAIVRKCRLVRYEDMEIAPWIERNATPGSPAKLKPATRATAPVRPTRRRAPDRADRPASQRPTPRRGGRCPDNPIRRGAHVQARSTRAACFSAVKSQRNRMQNFYEATVTRQPYPQLTGTIDTQVCIVGGGLAGLCTALGLVERGVQDVVVLDSERVGFGASGRNGGFVFGGYSLDNADLLRTLGRDEGRRLYRLTVDAVDLIRARIARYGIDCDIVDWA